MTRNRVRPFLGFFAEHKRPALNEEVRTPLSIGRILKTFAKKPVPWIVSNAASRTASDLTGPLLAVVVICYKMDQQIEKTLLSLSLPYQRGVAVNEYEIHLVDNGSPQTLPDAVWNISPNIRYHYVPPGEAPVNPGTAINRAVANTRSPLLCVLIDGARMLTPGVLRWGMDLSASSTHALVDVRSWHLGHKSQNDSLIEGYSPDIERELLAGISWPSDGYRLFEIGFPSNPTRTPFQKCVFESNCLFISRHLFDQIGGFDERYTPPGGGLAGVDFFHRAVANSDLIFTLLGEGTFHQTHGGAASGLNREQLLAKLAIWREEYEKLSRPWSDRHRYDAVLAGHVPKEARRWLDRQPRTEPRAR
jgi:hypothetical protein